MVLKILCCPLNHCQADSPLPSFLFAVQSLEEDFTLVGHPHHISSVWDPRRLGPQLSLCHVSESWRCGFQNSVGSLSLPCPSPSSLLALFQPGLGATPLQPKLHVSPHEVWRSARGPSLCAAVPVSCDPRQGRQVVRGLAGWAGAQGPWSMAC